MILEVQGLRSHYNKLLRRNKILKGKAWDPRYQLTMPGGVPLIHLRLAGMIRPELAQSLASCHYRLFCIPGFTGSSLILSYASRSCSSSEEGG